MRVRPTYSNEFKADAVALLRRDDRSLPQVAKDLGVSSHTLRDWYNKNQMGKKQGKKAPARAGSGVVPSNETLEEKVVRLEREVRRLERDKARLEMDREILKKAAAFFAKENE
jgi:transposase